MVRMGSSLQPSGGKTRRGIYSHMKVDYLSDIGRQRSQNQDRVALLKNGKRQLAVIADGIGGNRGGDVAAELTVQLLGQNFSKSAPKTVKHAKKWLQDQVTLANQLLIKKSHEKINYQGMGTTMVAAIFLGNGIVVVANIGDSRGYILHDHELTQITNDHSLVNELVKNGDITEQQARRSPQKNIITRAIGISADAEIDVNAFTLELGDQLLLCSDGLSKMVEHQKLTAILLNKDATVTEKCQTLVEQANQAGGLDNITVLVSEFDQERD